MSEAPFLQSDGTVGQPALRSTLAVTRRAGLRERGMATIEYALGVVVVVVIIGVVIAAIQTGTFQSLVEQLISAIVGWVEQAFKIPLPFKR